MLGIIVLTNECEILNGNATSIVYLPIFSADNYLGENFLFRMAF